MSKDDWKKIFEFPSRVGYRKLLTRLFELPDGARFDFTVIDEPDSVHVVAITTEGKVILAEQFRPGPECLLQELPGGAVDPKETPMQSAARELLEETGYAGEMQILAHHWPYPYSRRRAYAVLATGCKKVAEQKLDPSERVTVLEVSLDEFERLVRAGQVFDTASALMALEYLKNR